MRAVVLLVAAATCLVACGRLGFDPTGNATDATDADDGAGDPRLASITLWAATNEPLAAPLSPGFAPDLASYAVGVGLVLSSLQISATPVDPATTITIEAAPTPAGTLSTPHALALGTTVLTVTGTAAGGAVASYTIEVTRAGALAQQVYAKASNTGADDWFGNNIALSGDTLAVAAPYEDCSATGVGGNQADNAAPDSGAIYVFTRSGGVWSQQAYIKASNAEASDNFGYSLALSGDTLAVGALNEDSSATGVGGNQADNTAPGSGAVYVFARSAGAWSQQAYLKGSNTGAGDWFGFVVALSGDTLAVSAALEDSSATGVGGNQTDNAAIDSGAVYVFTRIGTAWSQQAYVKASNTGADDYLGYAVALSGDTLAIGARNEDSSATGVDGNQADNAAIDSGAVYVLTRSGTAWSQQAYLKASNTGAADHFGHYGVAISGDTLAVGARDEDSSATGVGGNQADNAGTDSGAVYVFARSAGVWSQQAYIKASNNGVNDLFGNCLALSSDTLVVGSQKEDSSATGFNGNQADETANSSGAAYVFVRTANVWSQQAYLKASNTSAGDTFGVGVALSGDTIVISALAEDSSAVGVGGNQADNSTLDSGAIYAFQ